MATTYEKLFALITEVGPREQVEFDRLVERLVEKEPDALCVNGKLISKAALRRNLTLAKDLEFLNFPAHDLISLSDIGREVRNNRDRFRRNMEEQCKELFHKEGLPFTEIVRAINTVKHPEVANPPTILSKVSNAPNEYPVARFACLLYLMAMSDGLTREVRLFYKEV